MKEGSVLFINQEQTPKTYLARIIDFNKCREGNLHKFPHENGFKDFGIGAQILHDLNINKLKVISNSKQAPRIGITGYGIQLRGTKTISLQKTKVLLP